MKVLLDTNRFLWFIMGSSRLSQSARKLIEDPNTDRMLSIASLWEMAIKLGIGKLHLKQPFDTLIPQQLQNNHISLLGITLAHLSATIPLPMHHKDPFDRLLIAQASVEQLPIVTSDAVFDSYSVTRLW